MKEQVSQELRRQNCFAGREEGERINDGLADRQESDRFDVEAKIAGNLRSHKGLEYNYWQGVWYAVSERPLCQVPPVSKEEITS